LPPGIFCEKVKVEEMHKEIKEISKTVEVRSGDEEIEKIFKEPEEGEGEKDFEAILDDQLLATEDTYVNFSGGEYGVGLTNGYN